MITPFRIDAASLIWLQRGMVVLWSYFAHVDDWELSPGEAYLKPKRVEDSEDGNLHVASDNSQYKSLRFRASSSHFQS